MEAELERHFRYLSTGCVLLFGCFLRLLLGCDPASGRFPTITYSWRYNVLTTPYASTVRVLPTAKPQVIERSLSSSTSAAPAACPCGILQSSQPDKILTRGPFTLLTSYHLLDPIPIVDPHTYGGPCTHRGPHSYGGPLAHGETCTHARPSKNSTPESLHYVAVICLFHSLGRRSIKPFLFVLSSQASEPSKTGPKAKFNTFS